MRDMRPILTAVSLLTIILLAPASAAAQPVHCHAHYVRREVRVREHRHGKIVTVKVARCVKVKSKAKPVVKPAPNPTPTTPTPTPTPSPSPAPTSTTPTPAPTVSYSSSVDPSFTQASNNPLLVTYSYSADAVETINSVKTDLADTDSLPSGILNFYSATQPDGPSGLVCSLQVGGAVSAGQCAVEYSATGTYQVTTQYIPNGLTAVTQTDSETISPFATTLGQTLATSGDQITVTPTVLDQNGNPLSGAPVQVSVYDERDGIVATFTGSTALTLTEHLTGGLGYITGGFAGSAPAETEIEVESGDTLQITSTYAGGGSYVGSTSSTATATVAAS